MYDGQTKGFSGSKGHGSEDCLLQRLEERSSGIKDHGNEKLCIKLLEQAINLHKGA